MFLENDHQGSSATVCILYHRYRKWLVTIIRRHGGGDLSEDVVQEAYLRLARMESGSAISHPRALLLRIAQNVLRNSVRRDNAAKRIMPSLASMSLREHVEADQLQLLSVREIILSLPESCRDVFVLGRIDGMTAVEIAEELGLSVRTVEFRMAKALALCAERLRD